MSLEDGENRPPTRSGVKFEIRFDENKPTASAPKRFSEQPIKASVSQEELEKKQRDAEERRKVIRHTYTYRQLATRITLAGYLSCRSVSVRGHVSVILCRKKSRRG